ncbi:MAG: hypothetical protein WA021_01055 [Minisyncoccia bacterium]
MQHWSVDTTELEKDPKKFAIWRLENAINFGIRDGKIGRQELEDNWNDLVLDPHKKKFLALLLGK